jgi:hypothetical protein
MRSILNQQRMTNWAWRQFQSCLSNPSSLVKLAGPSALRPEDGSSKLFRKLGKKPIQKGAKALKLVQYYSV